MYVSNTVRLEEFNCAELPSSRAARLSPAARDASAMLPPHDGRAEAKDKKVSSHASRVSDGAVACRFWGWAVLVKCLTLMFWRAKFSQEPGGHLYL